MVGGKQTDSGNLGAFITRVKKGSIAEKIGHLKPGDEVIMWNDFRLRGASFNKVYEAVLASKDEKLVSKNLTFSFCKKGYPPFKIRFC